MRAFQLDFTHISERFSVIEPAALGFSPGGNPPHVLVTSKGNGHVLRPRRRKPAALGGAGSFAGEARQPRLFQAGAAGGNAACAAVRHRKPAALTCG